MSSKKALHLITSLEGGGTENFLYQLVRYSPPTWNHEVRFLKKDGVMGDRLRTLGISVQKVDTGTLWQDLRKTRPDVLHTCLYRAHQIGRVVGRLAGVRRIFSSQRSIDAWQKPWHIYLDGFTLPFCDEVFVNSSAAERLIRHRIGPAAKPQITCIFNGIDEERFSTSLNRAEARREWGLPEGDIVVGGSLMRLHKEKGADMVLAFAEKALTQHPKLHLIIGGVGPLEADLRQQSRHKAWGSRLHWLGWVEETPKFYAALDFFWSLSREESFPQSLLEASGMGVPWLAPEVGGISDLINAGAPGHLYPSKDIENAVTLATSLILKENHSTAPSLALFRKTFSVETMVSQFYERFNL